MSKDCCHTSASNVYIAAWQEIVKPAKLRATYLLLSLTIIYSLCRNRTVRSAVKHVSHGTNYCMAVLPQPFSIFPKGVSAQGYLKTCGDIFVSQPTPFTEGGSGHAATIELSPRQKHDVTNQIHALCRYASICCHGEQLRHTCSADVRIRELLTSPTLKYKSYRSRDLKLRHVIYLRWHVHAQSGTVHA